jgi:hypothetical protein
MVMERNRRKHKAVILAHVALVSHSTLISQAEPLVIKAPRVNKQIEIADVNNVMVVIFLIIIVRLLFSLGGRE